MRILIAVLFVLAVPGVAAAQTPVDGHVDSQMSLSLDQPAKGFAAFTKAKTYETSLKARVTATDGAMLLSITDGDASSGASRGHLSVGSKRLASPLEATVGTAAFQPLDASVDPLLKRWSSFGSNLAATIKLRQKVTGKTTGSYRKLVLVTLSTETP
ncbi:hypothetical protein [Solirubrobacter soli]|uniref:hypothetical protein n=1 Tax=Solirubrobacter soli TaxID=363832 RepID=UPI0012FC8DFB|nr:hypothetical protein [Solirubrobacter soli]